MEKIDKLISKYKESLDKHRTNTKFGQKLYDNYIEELNDYSNRLKIRHSETDPVTRLSYMFEKFVSNYPLIGHEFFMTNMDSIIEDLNLNVVDDYIRKNQVTIRLNDESEIDKVFTKQFLTDVIKKKIENYKNIMMVKSIVRPNSSEINPSNKEVVINIYLK